jgi:hypothetical protein
MASYLTRKWVCSLVCLHSLVRSLTTSNHTLPSHPRLCSLSVASYDSQGLRWKYSNPPPHGEVTVHCQNHTQHRNSSYPTGNTLRLRYRTQPVNAVWGNSHCLLSEPYATHRYSSYLTGNILRLLYRTQPVNTDWGNSHCLLSEPYATHRYS